MTEKFDIFISHNSLDKQLIEPIVLRLEADYQIRAWLDKYDLRAAKDWEPAIQLALESCGSSAVVLGANGWGSYHLKEAHLALERRKQHPDFKVIPVLLPGANQQDMAKVEDFFQRTHRVDFSNGIDDEEAFRRLLAAIRGEAPGPPPMTVYSINRDARIWQNAALAEKEHVLYRGSELRAAQKITGTHVEMLSNAAVGFLSASASEEERNIQVERRRHRKIVAGLVMGLILIAAAAVYAFKKRTEAIQQRDAALSNLATIYYNQAQEAAQNKRLATALELTQQAITTAPPSDARLDIYKLRAFHLERLLPRNVVNSAGEFSPDLTQVIANSPSGDLGIWSVESGRLVKVLPGCANAEKGCYGSIFSPDGKLAAAAYYDEPLGTSTEAPPRGNHLIVWDVETGQQRLQKYDVRLDIVFDPLDFQFTPNSKAIMINSGSLVWDVTTDTELRAVPGNVTQRTRDLERQYLALSRNPDRNLALAFSAARGGYTATVWNITEGRTELALPRVNSISFMDFTDDASQVIGLTQDRAGGEWVLRSWDVRSGVSTKGFSSSYERNIVGMSGDGKVLLVSPDDHSSMFPLNFKGEELWSDSVSLKSADGNSNSSYSLAAFFSPSGKYVVTQLREDGKGHEFQFWHAQTGLPAFAPLSLGWQTTVTFSALIAPPCETAI